MNLNKNTLFRHNELDVFKVDIEVFLFMNYMYSWISIIDDFASPP